jgi:hypothetical protein
MRWFVAFSVLVFSPAAFTQPVAKSSAEVPVADFFRRPAVDAPKLSPDGKRIAILVPGPSGRTLLAVADAATPLKRVGVAQFDDADVRSMHWVNSNRLVFDAIDFQTPLGEQFGAGLYARDVDGGNAVFLVGRGRGFESEGHIAIRPLRWNHELFQTLRDGSDDVVVQRYNLLNYSDELRSTTLLRLNTQTRATRELVKDPPEYAGQWIVDRNGTPRAAVAVD